MPDWPFPRGDVWILHYRGTEIDDGVVVTGPSYEAGLDTWLNGESINNADVVVWYGAHFTHDVAHETWHARRGTHDVAHETWHTNCQAQVSVSDQTLS